MVADNDLYHWLESCLALARVNIYKGDLRMAEAFWSMRRVPLR